MNIFLEKNKSDFRWIVILIASDNFFVLFLGKKMACHNLFYIKYLFSPWETHEQLKLSFFKNIVMSLIRPHILYFHSVKIVKSIWTWCYKISGIQALPVFRNISGIDPLPGFCNFRFLKIGVRFRLSRKQFLWPWKPKNLLQALHGPWFNLLFSFLLFQTPKLKAQFEMSLFQENDLIA